MAFGLMHRHVKNAEMKLPEVEKRAVDVFCLDQVHNQFVRELGIGFLLPFRLFPPRGFVFGGEGGVVAAQGFQLARCPAPVFKHLGWCFHKVTDCICAVETGIDCS